MTPELCERWIDLTRRNVQTRGYGMLALALRHPPEGQREVLVGFAGLVHRAGSRRPRSSTRSRARTEAGVTPPRRRAACWTTDAACSGLRR